MCTRRQLARDATCERARCIAGQPHGIVRCIMHLLSHRTLLLHAGTTTHSVASATARRIMGKDRSLMRGLPASRNLGAEFLGTVPTVLGTVHSRPLVLWIETTMVSSCRALIENGPSTHVHYAFSISGCSVAYRCQATWRWSMEGKQDRSGRE